MSGQDSTYKKFLDQLQAYTYDLRDFYAFLAERPLPDTEYEKMLSVVHKVAGLCLTFDLTEEGNIARYIETRLRDNVGNKQNNDATKTLVKNLISVCTEGYEAGMAKYEAQERLVNSMESSSPAVESAPVAEDVIEPKVDEETSSVEPTQANGSEGYDGKELNILFVDDDPVLRMLAERKLGNKGYNITVAKDGVLAVKLAKMVQPDVILMDGSMPNMDGMEAATLIKEAEDTKHIPIFLLTGFSRSELEDYDEKVIDEHLEKPFKAEELVKLFEQYFPNHLHA